MRLAVVLVALHQRSSLEASPVDSEWLAELSGREDLELFVDQATPGSERLRQAGVPVTVSIKRTIEGADGDTITADALQARALRHAHDRSPFDAVVYGSDMTIDFAWFEPRLRAIPRGVALGSGLAHDLRTVWEDRRLFARLARWMWSLTGLVASADFLLSDVPPEAFGLRDGGRLPPRYTTGAGAAAPPEPPPSRRWVAVAATSLGARGLEDLVPRVAERVPPDNGVTYLILTRPPLPEGQPPQQALLGSCPERLRRRTVVVAAGADGVAADFLDAADVVVAVSRAELAVPGVASAARRRGLILLDAPEPSSDPAGVFPAPVPAPRNSRQIQVLTWESPVPRLQRALENVSRGHADDELLVLHAHGRAGPAVRLFGLPDLRGVDLVVWGRPEPVLGHPDPSFLYPYALAVRLAAVPAVVRAIGDCESIWDLICWAVSPEWIDRLRLLVLPAPADAECWEVREVDRVSTFWSPRSGVLPAPRWTPVVTKEPTRTRPDPLSPPRRRFVFRPAMSAQIGLKAWAQRSRWFERLRLGLPWRWGLLERAMRGRW